MSISNKSGEMFDHSGLFNKHGVYPSGFSNWLNNILFPLKMIIPQPIVEKIPGLLTNEDIRIRQVLVHAKGKLLDIGCGNNRLVKLYLQMSGEGIGVDVYRWDDSVLLVKNTANLPFGPGTFNTITFVASINHIPNRLEVLKEAHRLLATRGALILTNLSPFISKIWHKWAFWDKDQHERGMKEGEVWGFFEKDLTKLLNQAGFKVLWKKRFSWRLNQIYFCGKI
jgi:SAM-dependent methyltransferase